MTRFVASVFGIVAALAAGVCAQEGPHIIEAAPRVMVFPFTAIRQSSAYDWIGNGIEQSLLVEVNRPGSIATPVKTTGGGAAPTTQPVNDPVADAARNGATIAVFGSYQILNDQIRVTGEAADTANGQVLVTLKGTGSIHDLFKIEDMLDAQLQRALPQPQQPQQQLMENSLQDSQATAPAPVVVENDVQTAQPDYAYGDSYGIPYPYYSDFGYGGIYGGFISYGSGFDHRGFGFHGDRNFFPAQHPIGFYGNGFRGFGSFNGFGTHGAGIGVRGGGFNGGFHSGGFGGVRK